MVNEALRLIRIFHDLKAKELAEKLSISQSYLSEIENNKKTPSLELINKYSEVFNLKPSTILFFSEQYDNLNLHGKEKFKSNIKKSVRKKIIFLLQSIENGQYY
ncbi:MAG: helix-turn-helix transcriptional regulator [Candidatus Atribacteria bacterium]|nr:helix-turn-helix transcriptional regulator [Candidatus Atribacteria bacterium]